MHPDYQKFLTRSRRRGIFRRFVALLSVIAVFCTTYALILPGLTMENTVFCGQQEHTHSEECYLWTTGQEQTCQLEEQAGHEHDDSCYAPAETAEPVLHAHAETCYAKGTLICGTEADHVHGEACFTVITVCEETSEEHEHGDDCFVNQQTCTIEEFHSHTDACYETTVICGMEEGQPEIAEPAEPVLVCTEPVAQGHVHGDDCFTETEPRLTVICGNEDDDHVHVHDCYQLDCGLEAHEHTLICFSDPEADAESSGVWEALLANVSLTGQWADDVVAIAESQLGYTESTRNYEVREDNSIYGYSRYGAWYGMPYDRWSGMFAAFCLHYAGVEGMPCNQNAGSWTGDLSAAGLFGAAGETQARKGDLIFFDRNADGTADSVGIVAAVTEAQEHADASITVIEGDASNSVAYTYCSPEDPTILGYGLLPGQERISVSLPEEEQNAVNTDINLGPVVTFTAQQIPADDPDAAEEMPDNSRSILRFAAPRNSAQNLKEYIEGRGGTFSFALTDMLGAMLEQDDSDRYIVDAGTTYKLSLMVGSATGIEPGAYSYQLPTGLAIKGGTVNLIAGGVLLGEMTVADNGTITVEFFDTADSHTNVFLSVAMAIRFENSDEPIVFDSDVTVVIQLPPEQTNTLNMHKWGKQGQDGDTQGKTDKTKIYWQIVIEGDEYSEIPGSAITDALLYENHRFTESDKNSGIRFGAGHVDPVTGEDLWHAWTVMPDDADLNWTDSNWTYTIPETVVCDFCGELTLGSDGWTYYIDYTSTPDVENIKGSLVYSNYVSVDGVEDYADVPFSHGSTNAAVVKSGRFRSGTVGGSFLWEVKVAIPGLQAGQEPDYNWFLYDQMIIPLGGDEKAYVHNDMDLAQVTATADGQPIAIARLDDQESEADIRWYNTWSNAQNGVMYHREITFYSRCNCTEDACKYWGDNGCQSKTWQNNAFCLCWTEPQDVEIVFTYETSDPNLFRYEGRQLENGVYLHTISGYEDGAAQYVDQGNSTAPVKIPSLFKKELTKEFDGYIANYTITLNQSKMDIFPDGQPATIIDRMTDSLSYIAGSMVITTEDADGNVGTLTYGTDYTLTYNGTANSQGEHILTIELFAPQPVMYTLNYDTTLIISGDISDGVEYSNSATVSINNKGITAESGSYLATKFNFTAKEYRVEIEKKAAGTDMLLPGAVYGLYNEAGGLIASQTTENDGKLIFVTSVTDGIILQEHEVCYIQEISAPDGYRLDDTKYWFFFCDSGDSCTAGNGIKDKYPDIIRIPGDTLYTFRLRNDPVGYELPNTGGEGVTMYFVTGTLLSVSAAILLLDNQRKRRRGAHKSH